MCIRDSRYEAEEAELLAAVGFYATGTDTTYEIYFQPDGSNGREKRTLLQAGSVQEAVSYTHLFLFYINVWRCRTISELMINEQIRDREIRLIGENGEQLGIMSAKDAMKLAREAELDLVKIAPTAKPPVCKIIDYGKYRYELARKEKEARKKQKTIEIKEVRLSPNIDVNDLNTKVASARKFLTKGNKVKVSLRFRGREMAHMQASRHILENFAKSLEDVAAIDKPIKQEGRSLTLFLMEKRS